MPLHFASPAPPTLTGFLLLLAQTAGAHGGGLNSEGCHNNRKTGDYHCHGAGRSTAAASYQQAPAAASQRGFYAARAAHEAPAFANCGQVKAAGLAPIYRGQPGYAAHLDRDNDGVACEPYKGR